jgi:hypothetical protein
MPKTTIGKWSVGLIGAFFILLMAGSLVASATGGGGETFFDNIPLSLTMLGAVVSGVLAGVVGLVAVIKKRERAVLVYIAILIGLMITVFMLGEFIGPDH